MPADPEPRTVALTAIRRADGAVLLGIGTDPAQGGQFCRPVGGGIEAGETPEQAARREILEEIGHPLGDLRPLAVVDNLYVYRGQPGREIAHLFEGRFADPALESVPEFPVAKKSVPRIARWFPVEHLGEGRVPVVPEGLLERLAPPAPPRTPLRVLAVPFEVNRETWFAEASGGRLQRLRSCTGREEIVAHVLDQAREDASLVVGLGFPLLPGLRAGGFAAWPLESPRLPALVSIHPGTLLGGLSLADPVERGDWLEEMSPGIDRDLLFLAATNPRAFAAAVSALAMDARRGELLSLPPEETVFIPWDATHPR